MRAFILGASFLLVTFAVQTAAGKGLCDFPVPAVQYDQTHTTGTSKAAYDRVLNQVEKVYGPKLKRLGYTLKMHRSWSNPEVNAQAWWEWDTQVGWICNVEMFGGLARAPGITSPEVRQVALHEIGHCIAGPPYYAESGKKMSCEGQADIWSTAVGCRDLGIDCRASSLKLARALASWSGDPRPSRPVPPLRQVSRTYCGHPEGRCRLLSYDAGIAGLARPGCWYR